MAEQNDPLFDTTQQVTSKVPTTHVKPDRVEAGKAIAERSQLAKEAQKQKNC